MDFKFEFYAGTDFLNPAPLQLLVTSFDIDFNQQLGFETSHLASYYLGNLTSINVSATDQNYPGYTKFFDPNNTDSSTKDPRNAFAVLTNPGTSSFTIRARHTSVALYEFEFRNPPANTTLANLPSAPELSTDSGTSTLVFMTVAFSLMLAGEKMARGVRNGRSAG